MAGAFVGRQAIYDSSLDVHAYELLYRDDVKTRRASFASGDRATAQVMSDAFLEIGAQRIAGDLPCFLNLTEGYITGELPLPLPAERVVVEVLEDVLPTDKIVEGVQRLKDRGVLVALDDYVHREGNEPLLEMADYVKVDLMAQGRDETRKLVEELQKYRVKLLAEKIETQEEMRFCRDLGFEYFQGFFLTKPEIVKGHRVPANRVGLLRILSRLLDPDVDVSELGDLISQDVSLAYKLLRHANSTLYAPREEITAVQQSLVLLGLDAIREIVSLVILIDLDDGPGDLVTQSLIRAKMCQTLAERAGHDESNSYFTVGLLSTLDALTHVSMEQVLEHLPLSDELSRALLGREGSLGEALSCVQAHERGEWEDAAFESLSSRAVCAAYADAAEYSSKVWSSMPKRSAA